MTDALREAFEKWITDPPYESQVDRYPDDPVLVAWPGHYVDITVQLAWEAWQEGFRTALQEPAPVVAREPRAIHALKTWPEAFKAVVSGEKRHEVRRADRDFRAGDVVVLQEFDPASGYTREARTLTIGHISAPGTWGLPVDVCVFTLLDAAPQAPVEPAPVVQPDTAQLVEEARQDHTMEMMEATRRDTIEECAKVCDEWAAARMGQTQYALKNCAAAIRSIAKGVES